MSKKAHLDRLAQLHDEDLAQVIRAVEIVILGGEAHLKRSGMRLLASNPRDAVLYARDVDEYKEALLRARHEALFRQEFPK